eukprot:scaffold39258_cov67-Phaeocystis_antarctica.AAC.4
MLKVVAVELVARGGEVRAEACRCMWPRGRRLAEVRPWSDSSRFDRRSGGGRLAAAPPPARLASTAAAAPPAFLFRRQRWGTAAPACWRTRRPRSLSCGCQGPCH